jgi:hypothetical protein
MTRSWEGTNHVSIDACAHLTETWLCNILCELYSAVWDISGAPRRWSLALSLKAAKHVRFVVRRRRRPPCSSE